MANLFCYLRILIVKTAINQTFDKSQFWPKGCSMIVLILMALGKFHTVYYHINDCTVLCF